MLTRWNPFPSLGFLPLQVGACYQCPSAIHSWGCLPAGPQDRDPSEKALGISAPRCLTPISGGPPTAYPSCPSPFLLRASFLRLRRKVLRTSWSVPCCLPTWQCSPRLRSPKRLLEHTSVSPERLYLVEVGLSVTGQKSSPLEPSGLGRDRPRGRLSACISALDHHRVRISVPSPAQRKAGI